MCGFCGLLYSEKQADNKLFNEGAADLIYYDDNGELNIQVDTGDPYESGILSDITFCPYCGSNLKEFYGSSIKGILKEKERDERGSNNDGWCNTCEYKHLESECLGCAKYDEYDNLIALSHYKKEGEDESTRTN